MKTFKSFFGVALSTSVLAATLILSSCGKDDAKSKTELLTAKSWSRTKVEAKVSVSGLPSSTSDVTSDYLQACEKDNVEKFTKDFKYTLTIGTDDCDGDEKAESGTWAWKDGEKILSITVSGSTEDRTLESISDSSLKFKESILGVAEFITTWTGK